MLHMLPARVTPQYEPTVIVIIFYWIYLHSAMTVFKLDI